MFLEMSGWGNLEYRIYRIFFKLKKLYIFEKSIININVQYIILTKISHDQNKTMAEFSYKIPKQNKNK